MSDSDYETDEYVENINEEFRQMNTDDIESEDEEEYDEERNDSLVQSYMYLNPLLINRVRTQFIYNPNLINNVLSRGIPEYPVQVNVDVENVINESLYERSEYYKVIADEEKEKCKSITYSKTLNINDKCPIMQTEFEEGQMITLLPCNHGFMREAIEYWLEMEKAICPICRYEFKSKEVKRTKKRPNFIEPMPPRVSEINTNRLNLINSIMLATNPLQVEFEHQEENNSYREFLNRQYQNNMEQD